MILNPAVDRSFQLSFQLVCQLICEPSAMTEKDFS